MRFGWAVEAGVIIVFFSPLLWGLSALLDLPKGVKLTFMWMTVFLVVCLLAAMVAAPFVSRSERRAWSRFTAPSGVHYEPHDAGLAARLASFPAYPFDLGPAQLHAVDVLRTTYDGVPVSCFTLVRKVPNEPRDIYQMVVAELPGSLPFLGIRVPLEMRGAGLRGNRVQIEYAEFNARYLVSTYDGSVQARKYAVDVLNPRAVQGLLEHEPHDITIAGRCAVSTGHFPGKPDHTLRLLQTHGKALAAFVGRIPAHVYATYGDAAGR